MKLTRTKDGYVVAVPDDVVAALGLREGDAVTVVRGEAAADDEAARARAIATMERYRGVLPAGYKFDREEANAR